VKYLCAFSELFNCCYAMHEMNFCQQVHCSVSSCTLSNKETSYYCIR